MQTEDFIAVQEFCSTHDLEVSFIHILQEFELVEFTTIEETTYISLSQLQQAEKIARMYYELGINMEGIDAIKHLLHKVENMQQEITSLQNRLSLYEE
ncbi:MAG: chaperone modulator CbpM [Bacteroidia bacterium]|nr:chaperone modulator CbpM [Bacteroidia bacterium]